MDTKGEECSFLTDFVGEDIMTEFFSYQQIQTSETASDSCSYGGGMIERVSSSSNIGDQTNDKMYQCTGKKKEVHTAYSV